MRLTANGFFGMLQRYLCLQCLIVLLGVLLITPTSSKAQQTGNGSSGQKDCSKWRDYTPKDTGDTVEGPICVGVKFNALRYGGQLGRTVQVTAGPNLSTGLTPPAAASGVQSPLMRPFQPTQPDTLPAIQGDYQKARDMFYGRDKANVDAEGIVAQAVSALRNLVLASDDVFSSGGSSGASAVIARARDSQVQDLIRNALLQKWNTSDDIYSVVRNLQGRLQDFSFANPKLDETQKAEMTLLQADITSLLTDIAPSRTGGDRPKAFNKQWSTVAAWDALIKSLNESSFVLKTYVGCGIVFNQNKQIAVRFLQTDRLPSFDGTALAQIDLKDPFVTVTCASPFAVSVGVEFSFLSTNTFGIVPSGSSGTNQFGITETDHVNPLPIAMVHGRIHEWLDHKLGFYGSFGVAAHILGNSSGGSGAEYLTGLSFALGRTIFLTPGWHVGRVSALNGGYKVGDTVPTNVNAAPVTSSYKSGFGLALTLSKP